MCISKYTFVLNLHLYILRLQRRFISYFKVYKRCTILISQKKKMNNQKWLVVDNFSLIIITLIFIVFIIYVLSLLYI